MNILKILKVHYKNKKIMFKTTSKVLEKEVNGIVSNFTSYY